LIAVEKALSFQPDAVFYVATGREFTRAADYLVEVVRKGVAIPYAPLSEIVEKAGLTAAMDETTALRRLQPSRDELLASTYRHIAAQIRAADAVPVFVFLPQVRAGTWQEETPETLRTASAAGFIVIDLSDVYAGQDLAAIRLADWDDHPNGKGHRLIADRLYAAVGARPDIITGVPEHESAQHRGPRTGNQFIFDPPTKDSYVR